MLLDFDGLVREDLCEDMLLDFDGLVREDLCEDMLLDFDRLVREYRMRIDGVLHIGAHYGQEHPLYKRNGVANVAYFEPLKQNFDILRRSVVDKDVQFFNFALGARPDQVEMFVETANNGQSSSVLEPALHLLQYPNITFDFKQTVEMRCLDDIDLAGKKFNFINIDVQGYELEVFKGARRTLSGIDYIISEVNRADLYKNCARVEQLDDFLDSYNFKRVETSWDGSTWGDALYLKEGS
jgi:FkbM family methyltransferase